MCWLTASLVPNHDHVTFLRPALSSSGGGVTIPRPHVICFPAKNYESKPRVLELSHWRDDDPRERWLARKLRYGALSLEGWWPSRALIGPWAYLRAGWQREITSLCPEVFKGVGAMAVRERQKWLFYLSILFIIHFNWALFSIKSSSLPRDLYFLWPKIIIILSTM